MNKQSLAGFASKKGNVMLVVVLVVVLGLAAGAYFLFNNGAVAPTPVPIKIVELDVETMDKMDLMSEADVLTANLEDVSGGSSSGTAYILRKEGKLVHQVEAELPDPENGNVYEGWLVQQKPLQLFSTGVMQKNEEGNYIINFESDMEYEGYNFVVITLETVVDETPETHILEGIAS